MKINARKPLHNYNNGSTTSDEDYRRETQEDYNIIEEIPSNDSDLDFYEEEDSTNYIHETEHSTATRSPSLEKYVPKSKVAPVESSKRFPLITIIVIVILAIIVGACTLVSNDKPKYCHYDKLQEQYPQQEQELWHTLKVGIELILNRRTHSPAVYLFVHQGGERVFKLVKDIARQSSKCFGPQMRPIEMKRDDFITSENGIEDYGHVIEKYRAKLKEGNVFLIVNLNEIPAEAARALHTICDTYSPLAENMVIFLTLTIPPIAEGTATSNAENVLIDLWSPKLDRNELDPLITRVTDQVIALNSF